MGSSKLHDARAQYQWRKTTSYIFYASIAVMLGVIWLGDLSNLATYSGLVTAGLAITLSDPISNVAGWVLIFWRRLFDVGDRIQLAYPTQRFFDARLEG